MMLLYQKSKQNETLQLISEQHYSEFFLILCYIHLFREEKSKMEKFEFDSSDLAQGRTTRLDNLTQARKQRLETATEISWNEYDDEGSLSNCKHNDLADQAEGTQLNDVQKHQQAQKRKAKELQNPHQIIRQGFVQRQTSSFINRWQICYSVLTLSKLYFFQDQTKINLVSCINLANLSSTLTKNELTFTIAMQEFEGKVCFRVFTEWEAQVWQHDIGSIILYHIDSCKIRLMQSKKSLYHEKDAMTQKEFLETAETGDVILMSTTDTQCAMQRFVTNSQYDHIGLVVNFNGQVKIFESNPDQGVNVYNWVTFQAEFHQYQKIAIRKLHYHKKGDLHPMVMKFIKSSIGKKYDLRALKLMRKVSGDEEETEKGYFCSQLVAKVYKKLGLLEKQKASSSYWPVDFTSRGGLNLFDDAFLGEERLIILNKHIRFHS